MKTFLQKASEAYYNGNPIISDAEFDILSSHFDYKDVGYKVTGGIEHFHPMYSLENYWDLEDAPFDIEKAIATPKLDGAAISILYVNGLLVLALTRGDGKRGRNITDKIKLIVPNTLKENLLGFMQVTGEVVARKDVKNARNVAAGALNLKDVDEFMSRDLAFVAYDALNPEVDNWTDKMSYLSESGFKTVLDGEDLSIYPTDGVVYRINNMAEYASMGKTSKFPKGAFALKEKKRGVITKLLDVIWQISAKGALSPVAILEPVDIGDATVSRATLHNIDYINDLDLEIGCSVEVIRSGEIIPRVVARVY